MTEYLSAQAASDYLRNTLVAFELGVIGRVHYDARLRTLRQLADSSNGAARFAFELLGDDEQQNEWAWPDAGEAGGEEEANGRSRKPYVDPSDGSLAFRIISGPLKDWEFHQADDDFFPSVPHGHFKGQKQPKLDAYLGWVYQGDKQIQRVARDVIVRLWNDRAFRNFAKIAISYYLTHHPHYRGWRVDDPLLLPAIRRGRRYR